MRIIESIRQEHRLVDRLTGSIYRWAHRGDEHAEAKTDLADLVAAVRSVVLDLHHRTEEVLFSALVEHGEIPGERGPLAVLRREHDQTVELVDSWEASGAAADAMALAAHLWQHLDKEESVLLPEAERRLIDGGRRHVDEPPRPDDTESIIGRAEEIVDRLPPMEDPDLIRGDGCIACSVFAEQCHGIEAEWWSDWEREHHAGLDEG